MNAKRSLRLRGEVLAELANDELELVVGADAVTILTICYGVCHSWPPALSCVVHCPVVP